MESLNLQSLADEVDDFVRSGGLKLDRFRRFLLSEEDARGAELLLLAEDLHQWRTQSVDASPSDRPQLCDTAANLQHQVSCLPSDDYAGSRIGVNSILQWVRRDDEEKWTASAIESAVYHPYQMLLTTLGRDHYPHYRYYVFTREQRYRATHTDEVEEKAAAGESAKETVETEKKVSGLRAGLRKLIEKTVHGEEKAEKSASYSYLKSWLFERSGSVESDERDRLTEKSDELGMESGDSGESETSGKRNPLLRLMRQPTVLDMTHVRDSELSGFSIDVDIALDSSSSSTQSDLADSTLESERQEKEKGLRGALRGLFKKKFEGYIYNPGSDILPPLHSISPIRQIIFSPQLQSINALLLEQWDVIAPFLRRKSSVMFSIPSSSSDNVSLSQRKDSVSSAPSETEAMSAMRRFILILRNAITKQKQMRVFTLPIVKEWVSIRFRWIWLNEALTDVKAVNDAKSKAIRYAQENKLSVEEYSALPVRRKVFERFVVRRDGSNTASDEWAYAMPLLYRPNTYPEESESTTQMNSRANPVSLLFVPGLLNGLAIGERAFNTILPSLEKSLKLNAFRANAHPMGSCQENTEDIYDAIRFRRGLDARSEKADLKSPLPGDIILFGYSKGAPDAVHALVDLAHAKSLAQLESPSAEDLIRPSGDVPGGREHLQEDENSIKWKNELRERIKVFINYAGANGGSYMANNSYASLSPIPIKGAPDFVMTRAARLMNGLIPANPDIDRPERADLVRAVHAITTEYRCNFMNEHIKSIDNLDIPVFSVCGAVPADEVPFFQSSDKKVIDKFTRVNDMTMSAEQVIIPMPMQTELACFHAHHWDLANEAFPAALRAVKGFDVVFPKKANMFSLCFLLDELGLVSLDV